MKIVILGAGGVIGGALYAAFSSRFPQCIGLTTQQKSPFVTIKYQWLSLHDYVQDADVVVYCVGVSKFAECEQSPEKSLFLNAQLPHEMLSHLSPDQRFVYFSSPISVYNFGSAEQNLYAIHKRVAEEGLQGENVLIIRPSKVIESVNIIQEWKSTLSKGKSINAFEDQWISPISATILPDQILRLIDKKCRGAFNFSACDRLSYLDLAKIVATHFGLDMNLIEKKSARQDNLYFLEQDVLDCSMAKKVIGYVAPTSIDSVKGYLQVLA